LHKERLYILSGPYTIIPLWKLYVKQLPWLFSILWYWIARNWQTSERKNKAHGYCTIPESITYHLATAARWYNLAKLFHTHNPYNTHSVCLLDFLRM
jgi:hypothetical protein